MIEKTIKQKKHFKRSAFLVGEGGFEPPKAMPADLQSVPFGHSGILPYFARHSVVTGLELVIGVEPTTC